MYRHKMMWAYNQSRFLKKRLKTGAVKIEECRKELDLHTHQRFNADKLQKTLNKAWQTLSDYTTALNLLEHQARTIEINLHNYQKRLLRIEAKAGQKLSFLEKMSDKVRDKYLLQVKNDYTGFSHPMRLLENIIGYIRASVAIEEEKRDRAVINTGAIWGIGLATGAIVASIQFPTHPTQVL
jgi:hypothetical protein